MFTAEWDETRELLFSGKFSGLIPFITNTKPTKNKRKIFV